MKKAEVLIDSRKISLLNDFNDDFWACLVRCCNAQILSCIDNQDCKAFLLSESSLFVWHDRIVILTCGVTQLVKSVEYFIEQLGAQNIVQLTYQRKNEYFAHAQPSSFGDDIRLLSTYLPGKAYRFGELDSHHNYVFVQDTQYLARPDDKTYELLAYQISAQASAVLTSAGLSATQIRTFLQLETLLPGFILDDFVFQPCGYSLNALCGAQYLTIHVTPQASSSYISVESNLNLFTMMPSLLAILAPASFDLLSFNETQFAQLCQAQVPKHYVCQSLVKEVLDNANQLCFATYILPQHSFRAATALNLGEENNAL